MKVKANVKAGGVLVMIETIPREPAPEEPAPHPIP